MHIHKDITALLPEFESNVNATERLFSLFAGAWLFYRAMSTPQNDYSKALFAGYLIFRGSVGFCPLKQTASRKLKLSEFATAENINIKTSISVNKPRQAMYKFWRKLDNLPLFMNHIKSVHMNDENNSDWEARIPGGVGTVKWKAKIVKDIPNEHIGWLSEPDSIIENAGNVKFLDNGLLGTEIQITLSYSPSNVFGEGIGRIFSPLFEKMINEDIRNFKRYIESIDLPIATKQ